MNAVTSSRSAPRPTLRPARQRCSVANFIGQPTSGRHAETGSTATSPRSRSSHDAYRRARPGTTRIEPVVQATLYGAARNGVRISIDAPTVDNCPVRSTLTLIWVERFRAPVDYAIVAGPRRPLIRLTGVAQLLAPEQQLGPAGWWLYPATRFTCAGRRRRPLVLPAATIPTTEISMSKILERPRRAITESNPSPRNEIRMHPP